MQKPAMLSSQSFKCLPRLIIALLIFPHTACVILAGPVSLPVIADSMADGLQVTTEGHLLSSCSLTMYAVRR